MSQINLYSYDNKDSLFNFFDDTQKFPFLEMNPSHNNKLEPSSIITFQKLAPFKVEGIDNGNKKSKEESHYFTNKKRIFKVIYPDKISLFTDLNDRELMFNTDKYNFVKRTKSKIKMNRYKQKDNMRKMIKRRFINTYLKNALNERLVEAGFNSVFEYLPQCFVGNVIQKKEKMLLNKTLIYIFEKKELYDQNNLANYYHNIKILEQIKKEGNPELKKILNKKYSEIFEEYVNSKEFNEGEINRLKSSKNKKQIKDEYYIEKYIHLAKHYIEFCSK